MTTTIIATTPGIGLCNRLNLLFSHYLPIRSTGSTMEMYWTPTWACDGFFLDYFEPLPGVTFHREKNTSTSSLIQHKENDVYTQHQGLLEDLKLNNRMEREMAYLWDRIGSPLEMVAIHVRRTDHTELAKKNNNFTTDEEFFEFVERYPDKKIYLATDNAETQDLFVERYGKDRVVYNVPILTSDGYKTRQTSVKDAVIDLFACARALHFKGSGYSSFSGIIRKLAANVGSV